MRPKAIVQFEWLLLAALAIDLVNNIVSWPMLAARLAERGMSPNPAMMLVSCLLSPLIGLLFWYFVARRGSNVARWILTVLVALGVAGFVFTFARAHSGLPTLLIVATLAELLKVAAVSRLFTSGGAAWFGPGEKAA